MLYETSMGSMFSQWYLFFLNLPVIIIKVPSDINECISTT